MEDDVTLQDSIEGRRAMTMTMVLDHGSHAWYHKHGIE